MVKVIDIPDDILQNSQYITLMREDQPEDDLRVLVTTGVKGDKNYSVRCRLEEEDIRNILDKNGNLWITFYTEKIPEFMVFTAEL